MGNTVIGLLAHVDAGKTTLAESLLYTCGSIRKQGRVDHGDSFLDNNEMERERGITIFSKQAQLELEGRSFTLLDTPGHVDFSAEMERTLGVLDYAVLVISALDGVQSHTRTLWRLLAHKNIPVFIFVNKMDRPETDREKLMNELKQQLDGGCVEFGEDISRNKLSEELALCDELLLEKYLEGKALTDGDIAGIIKRREVFPCFFGSALRLEGTAFFVSSICRYSEEPCFSEEFGAYVYKISRDEQNNRLTHMRIMGGALKVKDVIETGMGKQEKINQIRIYSGSRYLAVDEACAGSICAVMGLSEVRSGVGLGLFLAQEIPELMPVLSYRVNLPEGCNVHDMFVKLSELSEELPELDVRWEEESAEIHIRVMGEVQTEIVSRMIRERYGVEVFFDEGSIVYKETLEGIVEGVGHFEPLRHYAEVHLIMEPLPRGSGLIFDSICSEDRLARNWQRLIMTHLCEKQHIGVLTGSEITDLRITLGDGRAHLKHTEGGDFRQATYRAVRNGLKYGKSILLEPFYEYRLEVPKENVGRAMNDIQRMSGSFEPPVTVADMAVINGTAPVSEMRGYQKEITAYTGGRGILSCIYKGYETCHNADEVIEAFGYDSEADLANPAGSVFCAHGAGFNVAWHRVREFMHLESCLGRRRSNASQQDSLQEKETSSEIHEDKLKQEITNSKSVGTKESSRVSWQDDKELQEIFKRTYGETKERQYSEKRTVAPDISHYHINEQQRREKYLLVDGYNIVFAWEELNALSRVSVEAARGRLMDILCNYQGYKKINVILVFDAYKVEGGQGESLKYNNINVVYTKEAETADSYIERVTHELGKKYDVTVATSDALEQLIIWGAGAKRMPASELLEEIKSTNAEIIEKIGRPTRLRNNIGGYMPKNAEGESDGDAF